MRGNKASDTRPEMAVRRLLHALGYRYRLHAKELPGKPDIVFWGRRQAIFVHGCFWHQHADPSCTLRSKPKTNREYWDAKLRRNVERDEENRRRLSELGWKAMIIWECEAGRPDRLRHRLEHFLGRRRLD